MISNFLYKCYKKIKTYLERNYILSQIKFENEECRKSCIIGDNVKIYNPNVRFGKKVQLYSNVVIWGDGDVYIDDNSKIGFNVIIYASKGAGVYIGKNVAIAANCYIIDANHTLSSDRMEHPNDSVEKIEIGDNVWLGANCVCAKGSALGNGAVLGACSFLNSKIPGQTMAAGSPAKIIKNIM